MTKKTQKWLKIHQTLCTPPLGGIYWFVYITPCGPHLWVGYIELFGLNNRESWDHDQATYNDLHAIVMQGLLAKAKFHVNYKGKSLIKPLQQVKPDTIKLLPPSQINLR